MGVRGYGGKIDAGKLSTRRLSDGAKVQELMPGTMFCYSGDLKSRKHRYQV